MEVDDQWEESDDEEAEEAETDGQTLDFNAMSAEGLIEYMQSQAGQ